MKHENGVDTQFRYFIDDQGRTIAFYAATLTTWVSELPISNRYFVKVEDDPKED
jgi:hypothetical protein